MEAITSFALPLSPAKLDNAFSFPTLCNWTPFPRTLLSVASQRPSSRRLTGIKSCRGPLVLPRKSSFKIMSSAEVTTAPAPELTTNTAKISVGDKLPEAELGYMDEEGKIKTIKVSELTAAKKVVIFAVPGAFTTGCSQRHVPAFLDKLDELKAKGVDTVACISVNDVFVMKAWEADRGATGKILFLSDGSGQFCKAMGTELDLGSITGPAGLGIRSNRYSMLVEDGVVKVFNLEVDGKISVSLPEGILAKL